MPERQVEEDAPANPPQYLPPVLKSIRVRAPAEKAFRVFTTGMDSWWPRSHHIGSSPMKQVVVEPHPGGDVFTEQEDGTSVAWGTVLTWEPPHRFIMAWRISPTWQYEPDLTKCSEVELRFIPADDGTTLVELEHRNLARHGGACEKMREMVNTDGGGWGHLLVLFAAQTEKEPGA